VHLWAVFFSCVLAYTIVIGDLIPSVLEEWTGSDSSLIDRTFIMGIVLVTVVLPLSLAKTLDFLRHTSLLALVCMLYLLMVVLVWAGKTRFNDIADDEPDITADASFFILSEKIFFALPIMCFAFSSHIQVYRIYREMGVRDLDNMMSIVHLSVGTCLVLYLSVGIFGYFTYYDTVEGNIFKNYPSNDPAVAMGKLGLSVTLICSCPLFMFPMRERIKGLIMPPEQAMVWSLKYDVPIPLLLLGLIYLLATLVPNVADVLGLAGATFSGAVMYLFPAHFYLHLEKQVPDSGTPAGHRRKMGAQALLVWGYMIAIAGTVVSIISFTED